MQSCVDLRVVGLIVDRSSAQRAEQSSQRVTGERMRGERRAACLRWYKTERRAFTAWRRDGWPGHTGELLLPLRRIRLSVIVLICDRADQSCLTAMICS